MFITRRILKLILICALTLILLSILSSKGIQRHLNKNILVHKRFSGVKMFKV